MEVAYQRDYERTPEQVEMGDVLVLGLAELQMGLDLVVLMEVVECLAVLARQQCCSDVF